MMTSKITALFVVIILAVAGCGGEAETTTTTPSDTTVVTKAPAPSSEAVDSLQDVRGAIVRIVAEGSFADPESGQQFNAAGSGSGFFIDSSGIAVTNNHVVTGAAFLEVYVDGQDAPLNARVLGASECSDLAVIQVEGDGYPFLDWLEDDITVGTDIYAAGFPLGDEEYTLLDGIVSKENADGESDWASVDSVIEHSADTLPGSSGGPIVTGDGKVVAVNYAGDSRGQAFGIGRTEALKVIPRLIEGENVTSIGINGQALISGNLSGIWVASVESGSPADLGGIKAGDLVTLIEGLIPATDGTMADYCDILRSRAEGDPVSIEVYRSSDDAFLEGTLNTTKTLQLAYSFANELDDVAADDVSPTAGYDAYTELVDASGVMSIEVPAAWTDSDTSSLWSYDDEAVGVSISAAEDFPAWQSGWITPGVFFGASGDLSNRETVTSILDSQDFSFACSYDARNDYSDALYNGAYDVWTDCDGTDTLFVVLAAETPGSDVLMMLQIVVVTDADLEALDKILSSFVVDAEALGSGTTQTTTGTNTSFGIHPYVDLWPGDCLNSSDTPLDGIDFDANVEVVSCDEAHEGEVFGVYFIPDADSNEFPGDAAVEQIGSDYCISEFASYVGNDLDDSFLEVWWAFPTAEGWEKGYGFIMCLLDDPTGAPLVGSGFQSGW